MDDTADNTSLDVANLLRSPTPSQKPLPSTEQDRPVEEILARCSTELIRTFVTSINQGATKEAGKAEEFRQELKRRLFRVIIATYVWSTSRTMHEASAAEERLAKDVRELLAGEREQGRSSPTILDRLRARLLELMAAVSRAVEAFTQF